MRFAQLVLTDDQLDLVAGALADAAKQEELNDDDLQQLGVLQEFMELARDEPHRFPITGKQAGSIRTAVRRAKGAAQPQSRKNKRKARQEKRIRTSKERRKFRKQIAESYNAAMEVQRRENEEIEQLHREIEERVAAQPKYRLLAGDGTILMDGIPAEFIVSVDTEESLLPKVIVPGG